MADNKKSAVVYCDLITTVEKMKDVDAGKLFKHFLRYINDQDPVAPNQIVEIVFEPIKQQLKRDLRKWQNKSAKNSEIAKNAWDMRKHANALNGKKNDAKNTDNDTVNVNDTVTLLTPIRKIEDICLELKDSDLWQESVRMKFRLNKFQVDGYLDQFVLHLKSCGLENKTLGDFKTHFTNWMNKKDLSTVTGTNKTQKNFGK